MLNPLRKLWKSIPTLITAFLMAGAVWVLAVNAADPTEEHSYPRTIPIEIVGQDPGLLLTDQLPQQLNLTLSAPRSVWDRLMREQQPVRAVVDLSGQGAGKISLPVQVQINMRPVKIIDYSPQNINVSMEAIMSRTINISLKQKGEVAVGYIADLPILSQTRVTVTGPESIINKVSEVRATFDLKNTQESFAQTLPLQILDSDLIEITGLTITPDNVTLTQEVKQRGGYRTVVVKALMSGQVARGYRVTNISVIPPAVTVYSSDPTQVNNLPGFIETAPLDLSNVKENVEKHLSLNLPAGINLVGDQTIDIQVGVSAIESSLTLNNMPITIIGLDNKYQAHISPASMDVIFSGPLPALDVLTMHDVHVIIDLTDITPGTYQRIPGVEITVQDLRVQSLLPASVEVTVSLIGVAETKPAIKNTALPEVTPTQTKGP